ncbi:MAG: hypothetical protein CVU10_08710 [Bacteroidetes bacterium HGW-Bacteroidetes-5]|jgi:hypothetical protein|nr:MAG: hypothetical protein A2X20_04265 [Bacteroidetes bacterium GWE2_40_15]PKP07596.1 MAG: hypothetical protein CVU10_08710 [Bacteroidetes bacterium HGW-Bacteroidetes-5]
MSRFLVIAYILVIVAGCRKNEFVSDDRYALLNITPVVNKDEATIAHQQSYIDLFKIGIQVTNSNGTELYFPYTKNLLLSNSDKWVLSKPVCLSIINAKIYAYYPFTEIEENLTGLGETAIVRLNIPKEQVMASQRDYMYASQSTYLPSGGGPIFYANPNVTLQLNHALSLISFVIFKEDFSGPGELSNIEITDNSNLSGLTINALAGDKLSMRLADGTIINGSASSNISVNSVENSITETIDPGVDEVQLKTMVNGYMYVVPSVFSDRGNVQFSLTIDNKVYTISHTGEGELEWIKGYQYIYKLRLTATALTIVGIIITDWDVNYSGEIILK